MFLNVSYSDNRFIEEFLSSAIVKFYSQLDDMLKIFDIGELYMRAGEKTFTDIFDKGLWQLHGRDKLISLQQIGVKTSDSKYGMPDLLVEYDKNILLLFECKWANENEKDPSNIFKWGPDIANKYYSDILKQANKYLFEKDFYSRYSKKYIIALTFSTVKFNSSENLKLWNYNTLDSGEFYGFNYYNNKGETYGIAVYGKVEIK